MNTLKAKIIDIQTSGSFSLVSLKTGSLLLKSIVIDTPETAGYLQENEEVQVIFKEMEVSLATHAELPISLQNCIPGIIKEIQQSALLARVVLNTEVGYITSVITRNAAERLGIQQGLQAFAYVKTNELMLSKE